MITERQQLVDLVNKGVIPPGKVEDALSVTKVRPSLNSWKIFIDYLLLWSGGIALACSLVFFVAYNWHELGRFARFALVEVSIVLAVLVYWRLGAESISAKVSLFVATILLGVLLALYGQIYQTGADPWQLFLNWALLMLPWAILGRFAAIWILWIALINLSIVLYHQAFRSVLGVMFSSEVEMLWVLFLFNTLCLLAWEFLSEKLEWMSERWAIRLIAIGSGVPVASLALYAIFDLKDGLFSLEFLAWLIWIVVIFYGYQKIRKDLFMLAGGCLSAIVVIVSFFSKNTLGGLNPLIFLAIAMITIVLGGGAAWWLKKVHREWHS